MVILFTSSNYLFYLIIKEIEIYSFYRKNSAIN